MIPLRSLKIACRPLVSEVKDGEMLRFLKRRLPRLRAPDTPARWKKRSDETRERLLRLLFRGHPEGLLQSGYPVEWLEVLEPGPEYRIRKLRYEGYPGLWVPALLYEPRDLEGDSRKVPAVLNPDGHHAGGKAMEYKQARCINLAKRGMLALNYEFLGMGELSASRRHDRIAHLDLVGIQGAGIFYLIMKRALDILLSRPNADADRVAMTGFSGGGWQTVVLSALDERITAPVPVAGHTAVWQRIQHPEDIGDMEQLPADFCTVADYDVLSGMLAPRPSLFIYNHADDCCFQTARALRSIVEPAGSVYSLLGAGDMLESYDNLDPGTHNYGADNRGRLYGFLDRRFGISSPGHDLPWEKEALTERELEVGLPPGNATLLSIAMDKARDIAAHRGQAGMVKTRLRKELRDLLHLPDSTVTAARRLPAERIRGAAFSPLVLRIDGDWSLPAVHARPSPTGAKAASRGNGPRRPADGAAAFRFKGGELVLSIDDDGRQKALENVMKRCGCGGHARTAAHVIAADILGTGELRHDWKHHMLLGAVGERPLGIQAAAIIAVCEWARKHIARMKISLHAAGIVCSVAALAAAALKPALFDELVADALPDTLRRLLDWPVDYMAAAPLFCFGLLERFDVSDLMDLADPVRVRDFGRGPLC
jgi:hypothetical protein